MKGINYCLRVFCKATEINMCYLTLCWSLLLQGFPFVSVPDVFQCETPHWFISGTTWTSHMNAAHVTADKNNHPFLLDGLSNQLCRRVIELQTCPLDLFSCCEATGSDYTVSKQDETCLRYSNMTARWRQNAFSVDRLIYNFESSVNLVVASIFFS